MVGGGAGRIDPIPIRDFHNRATRMRRTAKEEQDKVVQRNLSKRMEEEKEEREETEPDLGNSESEDSGSYDKPALASWSGEHADKASKEEKDAAMEVDIVEKGTPGKGGKKRASKRLQSQEDIYRKVYKVKANPNSL